MLIAAMGTIIVERSGIINIGNEGFMALGALFGVLGSYYSGYAWVGALVSILSSGLFGLIFAFFTITLRANQVVTGLAMNSIAIAFTSLIFRLTFGVSGIMPKIATYRKFAIPVLEHIPLLGKCLFSQCILVYIALLLVPITGFILNRTNIGLIVRSTGENPYCCDTVGLSVVRVRYFAVLYGSMLAGLGGSFISMGHLSFFTEGMIAGKGYMTLAAVVFGNFSPYGIFVACSLFGAVSSLQYLLQASSSSVPYQVWVALPYLFAVMALCLYRTRSNAPACSGQPFSRK
jgi:simple sugar transport system permease protein